MAGAKSTRRDPNKPGVAGLTADDWAALAEGRATVGELAAKAGVSPAAISKTRKKRQEPPAVAAAGAAGVAAGGGGPPPAATTVPINTTTPAEIFASPDALARSFAGYALLRAHDVLAEGNVGPAGIKAAVQAGALALIELRRLGVLADADDNAQPVELTVRVMTAEEIAALKNTKVNMGEDGDE